MGAWDFAFLYGNQLKLIRIQSTNNQYIYIYIIIAYIYIIDIVDIINIYSYIYIGGTPPATYLFAPPHIKYLCVPVIHIYIYI